MCWRRFHLRPSVVAERILIAPDTSSCIEVGACKRRHPNPPGSLCLPKLNGLFSLLVEATRLSQVQTRSKQSSSETKPIALIFVRLNFYRDNDQKYRGSILQSVSGAINRLPATVSIPGPIGNQEIFGRALSTPLISAHSPTDFRPATRNSWI